MTACLKLPHPTYAGLAVPRVTDVGRGRAAAEDSLFSCGAECRVESDGTALVFRGHLNRESRSCKISEPEYKAKEL